MRETIGLLGGTFNPIHYGHLEMAEAAKRELSLHRVILMPNGDPPHKSEGLAGKRHRLRMTELAAGGRYEISPLEVDRPGKTYTVDTLEALHALYPNADLVVIIGGDTLGEIAAWKDAPRVFSLCRFAVFARGDAPLSPPSGAQVVRLSSAVPPVSSTEIRPRVHRGLSLSGLTPPAVADYIGEKRLYDPPKRVQDKAMRKRMREELPNGRFKHVLGVEETIRFLSKRWGYDPKRAALAGLLHDCAKGLSLLAMQAYVDAMGEPVDDARRVSTALLHAPASAAMARAVYGVTDPEILRAIFYHNTGRVPMGMLDKLLCVADMTEPRRKPYTWMDGLRVLALSDLDAAVVEALKRKLEFIQARGKEAHPDTAAALAAMEKASKQEGKA